MADGSADKNLPPTAERLKKARQQGQVPMSTEVASAMMIAALLIVLAMMSPSLGRFFSGQVTEALSFKYQPMQTEDFANVMRAKVYQGFGALAPFLLGAMVASVAGSVLVSGWSLSPKAAGIKLSRLNPFTGFKELISAKSFMNLLMSLVKLTVILLIVYDYLRDKLGTCLALMEMPAQAIMAAIGSVVFGVAVRICLAMMVIAAADMVYQRWKYKRDLKMSLQDVKDERKNHDGNPQIKSRIRSVQVEMVRKRMLQAVAEADVVLVNPTHVAVALKYDTDAMAAPTVMAKGGDLLCEKIKEIARAHRVPIVHRPELARAIFKTCEINEPIPEVLFVAVAEVLAMIYRMQGRKMSVKK